MAEKRAPKALASLVLGIIGFFIGWIPLLGWIFPILAIIFGFKAVFAIRRDPKLSGNGLAIAGIVLGFLGCIPIMLGVIGIIAYFGVLSPDKFVPPR